MKFQNIGRVSTTVKFKEMSFNWELKKDNLNQKEKTDVEKFMETFLPDIEEQQKNNEISAIDTKLKSGQELSDAELEYLKENSPELYKEAMDIKHEREAYEAELRACKTKEDVERLRENKIQGYLSQINSIKGSSMPKAAKTSALLKIAMRINAISNEHMQFLATNDYAELPETDEKDEKVEREDRTEFEENSDYATKPTTDENGNIIEDVSDIPIKLPGEGGKEVSTQKTSSENKASKPKMPEVTYTADVKIHTVASNIVDIKA